MPGIDSPAQRETDILKGRVILVLSPQSWGSMLLSKHHYALELARRGNTVYFLNPPDNDRWKWQTGRHRIRVRASGLHPGLWLIDHSLFFPYLLKFHFRRLFNRLMRRQVRDVLSQIPEPIDLLWSFDLGNLYPLTWFGKKLLKIFHPVDEPSDNNAIAAAAGADILFSVTHEILEKYRSYNLPAFFVNHGLADGFLEPVTTPAAVVAATSGPGAKVIRAGMSGNLVRPDLDRPVLLRMISEHAETEFHFYGSYTTAQSNIGGSADAAGFIRQLESLPNVSLHGALPTAQLATAMNGMDVLLICYDLKLDQSRGTNYHKVLEYLSTGKVIVSNNITTYQNRPDLVCMIPGRNNNDELPALFTRVLADLKYWNSAESADIRKNFAGENTYRKQLDRINGLIAGSLPPHRQPVIH